MPHPSTTKVGGQGIICLIQNLYLFYILWGIAFSCVFGYSVSQKELLIGPIPDQYSGQ